MQLSLFDLSPSDAPISLEDVFAAYEACRKNKRSAASALAFELDYEQLLIDLWRDIALDRYRPSASVAFLVKKPVLREVFAAQFRDRVVHHLLIGKLEPLFEKIFIYDSYACRKGRGTLFGIRRMETFIRRASENYHKDCYILKLDVRGFFMHIDRALLWQRLSSFIKERYTFSDKEALIRLCSYIVLNNPAKGCVIKGDKSAWHDLPSDKSLFGVAEGCGLPIGNLTSQVFANFYMNPFDHFIKQGLGFRYYGRYVDDFFLIHHDKQKLQDSTSLIRTFLREHLHLSLHPKKIYLQHYSRGVPFLGVMIRPYHTTMGKRFSGNVLRRMEHYSQREEGPCIEKEEKQEFLSSVNSYLGIASQHKSYRLRKRAFCILKGPWKKKAYMAVGLKKISLRD